jgi:predicted lactoylglutathione lyase
MVPHQRSHHNTSFHLASVNPSVTSGERYLARMRTAEWGGYSGYFADPDGHVWEVAYNPGWTLAADGTLTIG